MENRGDRVLEYLRERRREMVAFVERLVRAESPPDDPRLQRIVLDVMGDALGELGYATRIVPGRSCAGHLFARPGSRVRGRPAQLLLGHGDTVWPAGTLLEMPISVADGVMKGPGTYDMKSGLAEIVYALRALHDLGLEPPLTPVVLINSDEESGSPESARYIRLIARHVRRAFVLEPALGRSGKLKTARKGIGHFTVTITGKAAHAGLEPGAGASAILELSYVIQQLFELNDRERGISVNVGVIDGGLRPNVIAPHSRAVVDVRIPTREDGERIERAIRELRPTGEGVALDVSGGIGRPPLEPTDRNRALWEQARELGREIGLELEEGTAGGVSDGNWTSLYTATLDGLGPIGDGAHANHEFIYLDSLVERCALLALLLLAPYRGPPS